MSPELIFGWRTQPYICTPISQLKPKESVRVGPNKSLKRNSPFDTRSFPITPLKISHLPSMARGSRKKRKNQNRSISLHSSPSMSKTPPTSSRFGCRRTSMSFLLLSSFTILLIYSTSKTTFLVSSTEIYSFEVINEFPHDPNAFTQVPLFLKFAILCFVAFFFFFRFILILMLKWSFWVCLDVPQFDNGWIVLVK